MDGETRLQPRFEVSPPVLWQHCFFTEKFCRPSVKIFPFLRFSSCTKFSVSSTSYCNSDKTEQNPRSHFHEAFHEQGAGSLFRASESDFRFPPSVSNVQLNPALFSPKV